MSRTQRDGTGGKAAHHILDAFNQGLTAFAQAPRGRGGVVEIKIHLRGRGDAELSEGVYHGGTVARVLHQPLDAFEEVILEGGLGINAQAAQLAGDFGLDPAWVADYS